MSFSDIAGAPTLQYSTFELYFAHICSISADAFIGVTQIPFSFENISFAKTPATASGEIIFPLESMKVTLSASVSYAAPKSQFFSTTAFIVSCKFSGFGSGFLEGIAICSLFISKASHPQSVRMPAIKPHAVPLHGSKRIRNFCFSIAFCASLEILFIIASR